MTLKQATQVLLGIVAVMVASQGHAATGRILSEQEASQANNTALEAEAGVFDRIGMGIALSLAQCEGQAACEPAVNASELDKLIETLDSRISTLVTRQEETEQDFTDVLEVYVDQREEYIQYQDDLENLTAGLATESGDLAEDSFAEDLEQPAEEPAPSAAPAEPASGEGQVDFSVFEDADEELQ